MKKLANGALPAPLPDNEEERLTVLDSYDILDTLPERTFDEITAIASDVCDTPMAVVSFVARDRQWFKSRIGINVPETDRDVAICSHAILHESVFEVNDLQKDERFNTNPLTSEDDLALRFYAGAPLVTEGNVALGTLCVLDKKPRVMTEKQKSTLMALSHLVMEQLELRLRNKQLTRTHEQLEYSQALLRTHNQKLQERNADLEKKLQEVERNGANILNTPAGGVINLLRKLQTDIGEKHELSADLEQVISLIGSHKLYEVDVSNAIQQGVPNIDSQTKGFLLTQLSNFSEKKEEEKSPAPVHQPKAATNSNPSCSRRPSLDAYGAQLANLDVWEYDAFELQHRTNGTALWYAGYNIMEHQGLLSKLKVPVDKFSNFLHCVEQGYFANPYHNSTHATDVLLACNYLVQSTGLVNFLQPKELLSIYVASIVHDLGHPGLNNSFLVNTGSKLAVLHNDRSVLENHHCVQAFKLLRHENNDFFEYFSAADRQEVRKSIIELVLATDMANHVDIMNQFQNRRKTAEGLDLVNNKEDRLLALKLIIKCADISNPARPEAIYHKWVDRVMEEFFQQGDKEKKLSMPISSFMDRETTIVPKCQVGFIQFICLPTFTALVEQFPGAQKPLSHLQSNLAVWKQQTIEENSNGINGNNNNSSNSNGNSNGNNSSNSSS